MNRFLSSAVLILGVLAGCAAAAGTQDERWSQLAQPMFRTLGVQSGLPNSIVTAINQDREGFLWIGSQGGMSRWDGYRFRNYSFSPTDGRSLPDNYVTTVHADRQGRVWVGTASGGLALYAPDDDGFVTYNHKNAGLAAGAISSIAGDDAGGVWIGTDTGLDHMAGATDPAHTRITHYRHDDADGGSVPADLIKSLCHDARGTLWVGTLHGLARRDAHASAFVKVPLPVREADGPGVTALLMDSDGQLWIGTTGDGVFVLNPRTGQVGRYADTGEAAALMRKQNVGSIAEPVRGEIWISSYTDGGLVAIDRASGRLRRLSYDAPAPGESASGTVGALFADRAGSLWLATNGGLGQYQPAEAVRSLGRLRDSLPGLSNEEAMSVVETPGRHLWISFARPGIDRIDPERKAVGKWRPGGAGADGLFQRINITTQLADETGVVWLATPAGLYRADEHGKTVTPVTAPWLDNRLYVRALAGNDDLLWIATSTGGLYQARFDARTGLEKIRHVEGLTGQDVTTMLAGPPGFMWVGTTSGLNRVDIASGAVVERITDDPKDVAALSNAYVSTLLTDRRGRLWVGSGGGIDVMLAGAAGRRRFHRLGIAQGLPNTNIDKLLEDGQGRVWSSTDGGIAVIDPETFAIGVLGRAEGVVYSSYWADSGVATASGELVFGGGGGITIVRPDLYRPWSLRPPVVVTEVRLGGKPVPPGRYNGAAAAGLLVQAEANSFAVEFAALDFTAPDLNRYAYRLEGYDHDWTTVDAAHRVASYTNLPPGQYRLMIRGSNRRGVWSEHALQMPVKVLPWWYQTWWFRAAVTLLAAAALYAAYRLRIWQLAAQRTALEREVAARTIEVVQQKALAEHQHREASERNAELAAVNAVAQMLAGKLDLDTLIALVGDQVRRMFGADITYIALLDRDGGMLHFPYTAGADMAPLRYGGSLGEGLSSRVIDTGLSELSMHDAMSCLSVPIIANGVARGALVVQRVDAGGAYKASDQRVLETIAAHIGAALQNALLFRQAESARARAEEATQAKSIFLANMSHEIRTPMNAVIGLSYLALNSESPPRQRDYLQKIHNAGNSLLRIISDILDFSKIEAGKLDIQAADFDLDDMLAHLAAVSGGGVTGKAPECNFDVPASVPRHLRGDTLRLGQVLVNLLNNAIKFTERGEVGLTVRVLEQQAGRVRLRFSVHDTGIGMAEDQIGRLFQAFTQADGSTTRKFGGTGLGLSICKNLIDLMGGTIRVESQAGAGSRFIVELWLERASGAPAAASASPLPATLRGLRVLVVDDNATARAALLGILDSLRIEAVAVDSAADAVSRLHAGPRFDLLLADAGLADLGGTQLMRQAAAPIRTALLTSAGEDESSCAAQAAGNNGFLVKPVTRASMSDALLQMFAPERRTAAGQRPAVPQFSGARILLAEDNEINQEIAVGLLVACGIEVDIANNGNAAIDRLRTVDAAHYQLVFMDLHMPELDGHVATRRLRQDERFDRLPIIAMTANAMAQEGERCKEEGFDDRISKPLIPADLHRMLEQYLPTRMHAGWRERDGAPSAQPCDVAGLDLARARHSVNGDEALLFKVLRLFRLDGRDGAANIRAAIARQDYSAAVRHAHSLRAVAESIGAARVARLADELERLVPAGAGEALDALDVALAELCAELDLSLPAVAAAAGAPRQPGTWHDELRRLAELMRVKNAGAIELFASCTAEFEASFGIWDTEAIQRSLDEADFDGAYAALRWVAHKHGLAV
ncbi:two-component regulator propeller domain-containing protein [Duganella sp. CT11-25]|uniref:two-component regulator propeller domain-containing protein n=1 Tax=unclassified Duganella TaxID=2636909 RepID=UPI0039B0295B